MGGRIKIYYCSEKIENKRVRTNESSENKKKKKENNQFKDKNYKLRNYEYTSS